MWFLGDEKTYRDTIYSEKISWDWISYYFEHIKYVNDKDLQFLWGKILAGEIVNQYTISKRTMSLVESLSREEAVLFNDIMRLVLHSPDESRNGIDYDYYIISCIKEMGGYFKYYDVLSLADAGLLTETTASVTVTVKPREKGYVYQGNQVVITLENPTDEEKVYSTTVWLLTTSGRELYKLLADDIINSDANFFKDCKKAFEQDLLEDLF